MIVQREPFEGVSGGTYCSIWLDEPKPDDFTDRLITELLAFAMPVGLGHVEAYVRRRDNPSGVITTALHDAAHRRDGRRHHDGHYYFDYVAGHRIKVSYWPDGVPVFPDDPDGPPPYPGLPLISSLEFEEMYGKGSLEGAVRLALGNDAAS